ncbi:MULTISPECIES: VirB8/TrbF family protein [unclassified Sphingopyxis]|jgi:type IV secretion system protein VirB8|uniref:virB8 family protein n=1 Tax=unclassified Sphingopyxis TaxID=2614943 RepID=UPI00285F014E|nr:MULTISPECIES: VirB8/TrbF family protein [unclassified Sphingopyxis]MDR6832088.1 type IV secretion system protein VirB8 [Sphingopyxis sp. BE122]MDR7227830.1 type IV secretion system protein VirB8 [Sphingopyxis sp. BE259]
MAGGVTDRQDLKAYFSEAASWDHDRLIAANRSKRLAWIIAGMAGSLAVTAVAAVAMLTPLKTVAPYVITVDKATGASEIAAPLTGDRQITYNEAVAKYFLADYVRNREGWIPQARREFFEGVLAMSSRDEQARWTAFYAKGNPQSPQSVFTDLDTVFIAIKSVTFVSKNVAQIRFTKTLQRGASTIDTPAIATMTYDTTDTPTTEQQRFKNPLGLEVQSYRADLEVTQ